MASSSSVSSSERRRRRKFIKNTKIFEGGGDSESSAAEFSDDDGRRTIENDNGDGANEATEFTIYDNRHHEEHYHDIVDDASYGTNHSLRMSLAARRKKLASMNSVGSLTDGGSIEGGSLREVRRKRRDRSGSLQSLDGSLLGGSWKDIFNASWTGSLVKKKKKKKTKDKKKEKKKKKKDEKKKSSKDRKAALSDKKSSGERRHENKDEEYDRKRRVKSKKENLSGKDGKERVDFSKGKEFRRSTNKHEEKKVLKKRRDDSSSSDSSLSSDFDASTMGSTIDMNSKKAFIYVDRSNVKDEKHNRIPGGGERRRITVDGSESERSRNRRFNPNSHRRISDGALINGTERRRALKTSSDSKLGDVKVSSIGTSVAGTTNSACDEVTGTCVFHPEIQLKKRSKLGGWKDVLRQCPKCIHAGSTSGPYDHRDARQAVHKRREVTDPRMAYSGVARGDIRIDRGRDKGRDDDRLRSASHSLTRRRIPPDRSMNRGDPAGSVKKTSSNRRADLIRQRHMASVQQNHRKDHHHRQPSYDSEFGKNHADSRRLEPHDMGKEKKYLHEAVKTRSSKQSGRDTYGVPPGSSSRNTKESHSTLKRQTSDKSKQFNYSAPVLDSQTKNSQLLQDAIAKERRRASTGEGPISKLKPTKESSPYSFKKQPISRSQPEGDCDNSLNEKKQQQKLRSTEEISVKHENYNHGPYISKQNHSHIEQQFSLMGIEKARFEGLSNQDANQEVNSNEEFKQFTFSLSSTGARANSFSEEYTGHGNGVEKISVARHAKSFDHILFPSRNTRSTENAKKMSSVDEECDVFESKQEQNPSPSMQRQNRSSGDGIDLSPSSKRQVDSKKFTSSLSGLDSPLNPKPKTVVTNLEWSVKGFSGLYSGEVNKKFEPHGEGELALADGISIRMKWINGYPVKDEENETMKESGEHPKKTEAATSCNHVGQDIQVEELDVHVEEKLDHMKEQSARGTQMSLEHVDQEGSRGEDSIPCYHIGDEGRRRDMMKDNDKDVALMRIASLQPKDNAFIRRTDGSWSYAEVKKITPDTIVFFASSKGATKAYIRKYWVSHIRVPKAEILPASKSRGNDDGSKEKDPVREEPAHLLNRFSVANVKAKVDDEQITDGRPTSILRTGRSFADRNSDHNGRRRRRRSVSFSPLRNEYEISSHTGETDDDEDEDCVGYQRFVTIDDSLVGSGYDLRGVEPL